MEISDSNRNLLKLYEIYTNREIEELNDLRSLYRLYFALNSGDIVAIGFITKGFLRDLGHLPFWIPLIILGLSVVGKYLSSAWHAIAVDGARWKRLINNKLAEVERSLLNEGVGLFSAIEEEDKSTETCKRDALDVNVSVAWFFKLIWWVIIAAGIVLLLLSFTGDERNPDALEALDDAILRMAIERKCDCIFQFKAWTKCASENLIRMHDFIVNQDINDFADHVPWNALHSVKCAIVALD